MRCLFKQTPTIKLKPLSQDKKDQTLLKEIGGSWYMEKLQRDYYHLDTEAT